MSAPNSGYWDRIGDEWSRTRRQALWRLHGDAVNRALLERWLPERPVRRLLKTDAFDEAVGVGLHGWLAERAARVHELDLSPATLAAARRGRGAVLATAADCRRLPFSTGAFDVVVSLSTLDHFDSAADIRTSLSELRRVLRPDGVLLLTLDNPANPVVALRNALPFPWLRRLGLVPYFVGQSLDRRALGRVLGDVGFRVEEEAAVLHAPRVFAVAVAGLLDRLGMPALERSFLRLMMRFEALGRWPTRERTGYFVAVRAVALA